MACQSLWMGRPSGILRGDLWIHQQNCIGLCHWRSCMPYSQLALLTIQCSQHCLLCLHGVRRQVLATSDTVIFFNQLLTSSQEKMSCVSHMVRLSAAGVIHSSWWNQLVLFCCFIIFMGPGGVPWKLGKIVFWAGDPKCWLVICISNIPFHQALDRIGVHLRCSSYVGGCRWRGGCFSDETVARSSCIRGEILCVHTGPANNSQPLTNWWVKSRRLGASYWTRPCIRVALWYFHWLVFIWHPQSDRQS